MNGIKRKMDLAGFVSMLLGLVSSSSNVKEFQQTGPAQWIDNPSFCNNLDCPPYRLVETLSDSIELREYKEVEWVSTMVEVAQVSDADKVKSSMFMKLFDYIQGDNVDKKKIAMTCPVKMGIYKGQGPACSSNITMSFYVAPDKGPKPTPAPKPTEKDVYFDTVPSHQYYVISFGGRPGYGKYLEKAEELGNFLNSKGITDFTEGPWYTAGYDSPFRLFNRHNEVWLMRNKPRMIKIH